MALTRFAPFLLLLTAASPAEPQLSKIAQEARGVIAVVDWFYVRHRACPQPSRPDELAEMRSDLGDGSWIEPRGQLTEISSISMAEPWLYYTSPDHPDKCTLWRKLGWDPALMWRRGRSGGKWAYDPGDGTPERPLHPGPPIRVRCPVLTHTVQPSAPAAADSAPPGGNRRPSPPRLSVSRAPAISAEPVPSGGVLAGWQPRHRTRSESGNRGAASRGATRLRRGKASARSTGSIS